MIIATVQAIGFFNSFNNPIVYAFMNENFKKSCFSTLSHCVRKPTQQSGAVAAPRLSVQFIKPQSREAFLEPDEGNSLEPHSAEKGPSTSSHGESSLEIMGEKISTIQTELPANSSSQVKWEGTIWGVLTAYLGLPRLLSIIFTWGQQLQGHQMWFQVSLMWLKDAKVQQLDNLSLQSKELGNVFPCWSGAQKKDC